MLIPGVPVMTSSNKSERRHISVSSDRAKSLGQRPLAAALDNIFITGIVFPS